MRGRAEAGRATALSADGVRRDATAAHVDERAAPFRYGLFDSAGDMVGVHVSAVCLSRDDIVTPEHTPGRSWRVANVLGYAATVVPATPRGVRNGAGVAPSTRATLV